MSHVIHVWESPVPDGIDAAAAVLSLQGTRATGSHAKFVQLAAALKQRWAEHLASHPDSDPPWLYDEPPRHRDRAVWAIQVEPSQAELAARLLAAAARPLGLVVFDDQFARLWLPDGRVFGDAPDAPAAASDDARGDPPLRSKTQVFGTLHDRLASLLGPLGWTGRRQDAHFAIAHDETRFEVGFGCVAHAPEFQLSLAVTVLPRLAPPWDALATRWGDRCHLQVEPLLARAGAALPGPYVEAHVRYSRVTTEAELAAFADACRAVLAEVVLPFLRSCQTLALLERRLHPPAGEPALFVAPYIASVLAAALRRPDVAALIEASVQSRREPWIRDKLRQLAAEIEQTRRDAG